MSVLGIVAEFFSERSYVHIERSCFTDKIYAPHFREKLLTADYSCPVLKKIQKKLVFLQRKLYRSAVTANLSERCVYRYAVILSEALSDVLLPERLKSAFILAASSIMPNGFVR